MLVVIDLYERSQVKHWRENKAWQVDCDAAVGKFNSAGCSKLDITRALMNHTSGTWKVGTTQLFCQLDHIGVSLFG